MDGEKLTWTTPRLIDYGTIEEITGHLCKDYGSGDDFQTEPGLSTFPPETC